MAKPRDPPFLSVPPTRKAALSTLLTPNTMAFSFTSCAPHNQPLSAPGVTSSSSLSPCSSYPLRPRSCSILTRYHHLVTPATPLLHPAQFYTAPHLQLQQKLQSPMSNFSSVPSAASASTVAKAAATTHLVSRVFSYSRVH